jgi:hypothetical protein
MAIKLASWPVSSDHPHVGDETAASSSELHVPKQQRYVHVGEQQGRVRFDPRLTTDRAGQAWARNGSTREPHLPQMGRGVRIRIAPNRPVRR